MHADLHLEAFDEKELSTPCASGLSSPEKNGATPESDVSSKALAKEPEDYLDVPTEQKEIAPLRPHLFHKIFFSHLTPLIRVCTLTLKTDLLTNAHSSDIAEY